MGRNGLEVVIHPLRVVDGAVGERGGDRLDRTTQRLHRLGALRGLTQFGRRARTPAPARAGLWVSDHPSLARREQGVEPVEQIAAILFRQILVLNGRGRLPQATLEAGAALGRIERLDLGFLAEQHLGKRAGRGHGLTQRRCALVTQDVVRVLTAFQQGEAERAA